MDICTTTMLSLDGCMTVAVSDTEKVRNISLGYLPQNPLEMAEPVFLSSRQLTFPMRAHGGGY